MSSTERALTPKAKRTQAAILDATQSILGEKGVQGVSVKSVCTAANVGRTSFYSYFSSTIDLIKAISVETVTAFKTEFEALHSGDPRGLERLENCIRMIFFHAATDPKSTLLLTSLATRDNSIGALIGDEILLELRGADLMAQAEAEQLTRFLTLSILATSREIALGHIPASHIENYVSFAMAACKSFRVT